MTCTKCGREIDERNSNHFSGGLGKYDSQLENCELEFDLCNECAFEIVNSFMHKDRILKTGYNNPIYDLYAEEMYASLSSKGGTDVY